MLRAISQYVNNIGSRTSATDSDYKGMPMTVGAWAGERYTQCRPRGALWSPFVPVAPVMSMQDRAVPCKQWSGAAMKDWEQVTFFRRTKSLVGLDIGSSAVKAVELRRVSSGYRVVAMGSEPLPPDCIVDGAIIDGGVVSDVIRQLFDRNGIKTKEVVASLSGNAVIVKKIVLPLMSDDELRESIYWEAEQYIPFDIQDVNLDY
jgi:hypothetical protein